MMSGLERRGTVEETLLSWVPTPDTRGTPDILWSCIVTLFLCSFSVVHPNIHPVYKNRQFILPSTLYWICQGLLMLLYPQTVIGVALLQFIRANNLLEKVRELYAVDNAPDPSCTRDPEQNQHFLEKEPSQPPFDRVTAFYVTMGGIEVLMNQLPRPQIVFISRSDVTKHVRWPTGVTFNEYKLVLTRTAFLIFLKMGFRVNITNQEITDKSKADGLTKFITTTQAFWMVMQVVMRKFQGLHITLLEFNTVVNAAGAMLVSGLYWRKPQNVACASKVEFPLSKDNDDWRALLWVKRIEEMPAGDPKRKLHSLHYEELQSGYLLECEVDEHNLSGSKWMLCDSSGGRCDIWQTADEMAHETVPVIALYFKASYCGAQSRRTHVVESIIGMEDQSASESAVPVAIETQGRNVWIEVQTRDDNLLLTHHQAESLLKFWLIPGIKVGPNQMTWASFSATVKQFELGDDRSLGKVVSLVIFNTWFPIRIKSKPRIFHLEVGLAFVTALFLDLSYGALHLLPCYGLTSYFPTTIERHLWYLSALFPMVISFLSVLLYLLLVTRHHCGSRLEYTRREYISGNEWLATHSWWQGLGLKVSMAIGHFCTVIIWPAIAFSRIYFLVEGFVALRSMPKSAYEKAQWTWWWPHV